MRNSSENFGTCHQVASSPFSRLQDNREQGATHYGSTLSPSWLGLKLRFLPIRCWFVFKALGIGSAHLDQLSAERTIVCCRSLLPRRSRGSGLCCRLRISVLQWLLEPLSAAEYAAESFHRQRRGRSFLVSADPSAHLCRPTPSAHLCSTRLPLATSPAGL